MKLSPAYVGIILTKNTGDYFLVRRINSSWAPSLWNFPGGLVEDNESILDAAVRETREEIGVDVKPEDFTLSHVLDVKKGGSNTQSIIGFYFITTRWHGEPHNNEPAKIADAQWFNRNALPENITEHALLALQAVKDNKRYMQHGW